MFRSIVALTASILFCLQLHGQLPLGATAPNIVAQDINGNNWSLYGHTSAGRGVIIDVFATWCGPCWSFHNSGTLTQVYNTLSHVGTVVAIEADGRTNLNCIFGQSGCNYSTYGNWATEPYPMINITGTNAPSFPSNYNIRYYPTVYAISPDNRAWEIRNKSYGVFKSWLEQSFLLDASAVVSNADCGGDGSILLNTTGGFGSLRYNWSNGETTKDLYDLTPGTYSVTVEDQNGYYEDYGPFVITGPARPLEVEIFDYSDVSCFGGNDGFAIADPSGGNSGYSYLWSNGQTTYTAVGLTAGAYRVTVTDSRGCEAIETQVITQPSRLTSGSTVISESCGESNGEIYVNAQGGVRPYRYDIGNGRSSSNVFSDLSSGTYEISVTDRNDCENIIIVVVPEIDGPDAHAGADQSMDCSTTDLTLSGSGSSGQHTYLWTTSDGVISGPIDELTTEVTAPGTYVLQVMDTLTECIGLDTVVVQDNMIYPTLGVSPVEQITCKVPETWAEVIEEQDVSYLWTTNEGLILEGEDSSSVKVGAPGWYFLEAINDVSSCVQFDSVKVEADDVMPEYTLALSQSQGCPDAEVTFEIEDLDSLKTFEINWTTQEGVIEGSDSSEVLIASGVGDYFVEVLNVDNGCISFDTVEVLNDWNVAMAEYLVSKSALEVSFMDASEGENLTWYWDFGDGNTSTDQNPFHTYMEEGTFEVCLTVTNECGSNQTCQDVEVEESRGPLKVVESRVKHALCFDDPSGEIELTLNGGYPPYTVSWSHGASGILIRDLKAGKYDAEITDTRGNAIQETYNILEPDILEVTSSEIENDRGSGDGQITLAIQGGTGNYSYLWSNGSTDNPATGLSAGEYFCEVRDENECILKAGPFEVGMATSTEDILRSSLTLYPNPGNDNLCLILDGWEIERVEVVGLTGSRFIQNRFSGSCIQVGDLPKGMYFVKVWTKDGASTTDTWIKGD